MKVLLLGNTGFVGTNVSKVLQENNIDFETASFGQGIDLRKAADCLQLLETTKPDFIINCAAHVGSLNYVTEKAASVIHDNTLMLLHTYQAAAIACPDAVIINPIANCAYPARADVFIEDEWWNGHLHRSVLSYGSTRRFMWSLGESYAMQYNLRSIYLLVPNMYGPFDSTDPNKAHALNALVSKFIKSELSGKNEVTIWGTGVAIREWLYAEDFGRIVLQILKHPSMVGLSEPLNIAQNFGLSVKELVELIKTNVDYRGATKWDYNMPDGAPKKVMDERKFRKVFPDFKFTEFNTGIKNTVEYYKSVYPY